MEGTGWREIPGFRGRYFVNAKGEVLTTTYGKPRLMVLSVDKKRGYRHILLSKDGVARNHGVHRLVAAAFLGGNRSDLVVRHLDGNPANNHVENLAWGTYSDNQQDTLRHGRHKLAARTHCSHGHEYTPENTYRWKGWRTCLTCKRAYEREQRALGKRK